MYHMFSVVFVIGLVCSCYSSYGMWVLRGSVMMCLSLSVCVCESILWVCVCTEL